VTTRRALAIAAVLALLLTACGDDGDDPTVAAPSASASAEPSASAAEQECPLQAEEVPPPPDATADLSVKPTVSGSSEPPPTEIQYADIVKGDGEVAEAGDQVEVKYVGAFYETGEEFDSSWSRGADETLPFGLCQRGVIPGFAVGPIGMQVGGRRQITIPSEFGYGPQGSPPTIPGGATLVFVVDLVSVQQT
jgi:FKBP-type peptidyl-prolyl cis-trans isomerase